MAGAGPALGQLDLHPLLVDDPAPVGEMRGAGPGDGVVDEAGQACGGEQGNALVVELVGDEPPPAVDLSDAHRVGDSDVVVEGRRGVRLPEGHERLDREPRIGGVDQEHRDALVAGGIRIGAGRQPHVVGVVGEAGEQLLAVDHPFVAVPDCPGAQRRKVGAGLGF